MATEIFVPTLLVVVLSVTFLDGSKLVVAVQRHRPVSIFECHCVVSLFRIEEGILSLETCLAIRFAFIR